MKLILMLLVLLAAGGSVVAVAGTSTNAAADSRIILLDPSFMPMTAGKVTLTIGALQRTNGVYAGDYKIKVFPYFLKNEKGRLAIVISDAALAGINEGKVTAISGTATTNGKGGRSRHIEATVTPAGTNRGQVKLWFSGGGRQMVFEPAYHIVENGTVAISAPQPATPIHL
jgi:hypothetical protein